MTSRLDSKLKKKNFLILHTYWKDNNEYVLFSGIYINSTGQVSIQGYNINTYTADGYLVYPAHALGLQYHVMTYIFPDKSRHKQGPVSLAIVGTEEETEVTLKFPKKGIDIVEPRGKFGLNFDGKQMEFTLHSQEALQVGPFLCYSLFFSPT